LESKGKINKRSCLFFFRDSFRELVFFFFSDTVDFICVGHDQTKRRVKVDLDPHEARDVTNFFTANQSKK